MKAMKMAALAALLVQSVCSCNYIVDLDIPQGNTLYVESLTNDMDTTFLRVRIALPSTGVPEEIPVDNADVRLSVNGTEHVMKKYGRKADGRYYLDGLSFEDGDRLRADVTVPGYGSVTAEDIVPDMPECDYYLTFENYSFDHNIVFKSSPADDDAYYGVRLYTRLVTSQLSYWSGGELHYSHHVGEGEQIYLYRKYYEPGAGYSNLFESKFIEQMVNGKLMLIFKASDLNDGKLKISGPYHEDYGSDYFVRKYQYLAEIFRLSDNLGRFISNSYKVSNNMAGKYGFAAPTMSYTNVTDGYGVVGCFSKKVCGWIDNVNPCKDITPPENCREAN